MFVSNKRENSWTYSMFVSNKRHNSWTYNMFDWQFTWLKGRFLQVEIEKCCLEKIDLDIQWAMMGTFKFENHDWSPHLSSPCRVSQSRIIDKELVRIYQMGSNAWSRDSKQKSSGFWRLNLVENLPLRFSNQRVFWHKNVFLFKKIRLF